MNFARAVHGAYGHGEAPAWFVDQELERGEVPPGVAEVDGGP